MPVKYFFTDLQPSFGLWVENGKIDFYEDIVWGVFLLFVD